MFAPLFLNSKHTFLLELGMSLSVVLMVLFEIVKIVGEVVISGGNNGLVLLCILQTLVIVILVMKITALSRGD
jgi:hypothetical protein